MANLPQLPSSWADVTHRQYFNLLSTPNLSFEPLVEQLREVIFWVTDSTEQEIENLDALKIFEAANKIGFLLEPMEAAPINIFEFAGKTYQCGSFLDEPLVKLILNQTQNLDSEAIAKEVSQNDLSSLPKILALWVYEADEQGFDMGNVAQREADFEYLGVNILLGFYQYFVNELTNIRNTFKELFKVTHLKNSENFKHIMDRYGWEISVSDLANTDVTKYNEVRMTPIFDALTQLEIRKLTAIATENLNRKNQ